MTARVALAAAVLVTVVAAQPAPQQPTFRTEANYIRVDVYPTKDGVPVADLTAADFEVLENNTPQKIEQFEHVVIRAGGGQDVRIDPNTVAESRSMAQAPRARLFVVFLDNYHVDITGSHNIRQPLINALDRVMGPDDLFAVMTPEMSATDITFARKTTTIAGMLARHWYWGDKDNAIAPDPADREYETCYPNLPLESPCADQNGVAAEMIARRHEKRTIDALQDLVRHLGGLREERKAILTVSNGWLWFRPNDRLARQLNCHGIPTGPTVTVDPRGGKLTTKDPTTAGASNSRCESDRLNLSRLDNDRDFRELLDEANKANASFYPIDPRGLAVFESSLANPLPLARDQAIVRQRLNSLETLAGATDGIALVNSNDLDKSLRRAVDDLSSYYLLGYYSTGKLDGRFHPITVRVKRPGVQVRARRGYLAATTADVNASRTTAAPKAPDAEALAIQAALAPLGDTVRDLPLRVHATAGWKPAATGAPTAAFWIVSEFGPGPPPPREVDVTVVNAAGATVARGTGTGGTRNVLVSVAATQPAEPGEYTIRVRAEGFGTGSVRVPLPAAPDAGGAVVLRRGQSTGNREVPTADLRFRRSEQIRIQIPAVAGGEVSARLLDRTGKALTAVPVTAAVRDDSDGARWLTANVALAPLAPGDYLIELTTGSGRSGRSGGSATEGTEKRVLVAFRVIP